MIKISSAPVSKKAYTDQSAAEQVAIRLNWKDTSGKWHHRYVQSQTLLSPHLREPVFPAYKNMIGLKNFLQKRVVQNSPQWAQRHMDVLGVAQVSTLGYDHMSQEYTLTEKHQASGTITMGQRVSDQDVANTLDAAGAQRRGQAWFPNPSIARSLPGQGFDPARRKCDSCLVLARASTHITCQRHLNSYQCDNCQKLNRQCTWTRDNLVAQGTSLSSIFSKPAALDASVLDAADGFDIKAAQEI